MEKIRYCVFCGKENSETNIKCIQCGKELKPKENLFIDFLVEHTKDELKGNLEDSVFEAIMNFLKSHLFGVVFTISLVSTFAVSMLSSMDGIERVRQMPGIGLDDDIPVIHENSQINLYLNDEQLDVKAVVDEYFRYARNTEELANADELEEALKSGVYEVYDKDTGMTFPAYFDVEEIGEVNSIDYEYSIIDTDTSEPETVMSKYFFDQGVQIATVFVYEKIEIQQETVEEMFLLTLSKSDSGWKVNEAFSMSEDEKDRMYIEDTLWYMAERTFNHSSSETMLPETFGYRSYQDMKFTVHQDLSEGMSFYIEEVVLGIVKETQMTSLLLKDGHKVAQGSMVSGKYVGAELITEKNYVITFVNIGATWYIAEVVED